MRSGKRSLFSPVISLAPFLFVMGGAIGLMWGCANTGSSTACPGANTVLSNPPAGSNVMAITVDGSLCDSSQLSSYPNKPCAQVTICVPGSTTQCQTISNLLVDTGSVGLRIFSSLVTLPLTKTAATGGGILTDCVLFGDNSSEWGPVATADVQMGAMTASNVPIHLIDPSFATLVGKCNSAISNPDTSPSEAGFNGILGVGIRQFDCGPNCGSNPSYYSCVGSNCTAITENTAQQVQNPVALLSAPYNSGIVLQLPSVDPNGACSANGVLVMGADQGTSPSSTTVFQTDGNGFMQTYFSAYSPGSVISFIDSGTNYLVIPQPSSNFSDCGNTYGGGFSGMLCGASLTTYSAENQSYYLSGTPPTPVAVSFQLGDAYTLLNANNHVFSDVGVINSLSQFDWGLPFFLGKNISIGIEGMTASNLPGSPTGPFYAY